jgi:hypothetical protein
MASVQMAPAQATAADPAFSETRVHEHATAMGLAARWPDLPESPNLDASELAAVSNSYADTQTTADAEEQMPLTWPVTRDAVDSTLIVAHPERTTFLTVWNVSGLSQPRRPLAAVHQKYYWGVSSDRCSVACTPGSPIRIIRFVSLLCYELLR